MIYGIAVMILLLNDEQVDLDRLDFMAIKFSILCQYYHNKGF